MLHIYIKTQNGQVCYNRGQCAHELAILIDYQCLGDACRIANVEHHAPCGLFAGSRPRVGDCWFNINSSRIIIFDRGFLEGDFVHYHQALYG